MARVTDDRRELLARLLGDEAPDPLAGEDRGAALLEHLLLERTRKVYVSAAQPWPEDAESLVHDVRVATRRLVEALVLASSAIGRRRAKRAVRRAKALRQALGASREAAVLVADFRKLTEAAGLDEQIVHALDAMSEHGQDALQSAKEAYPPERLLARGVDVMRLAATPRADTPLSELVSHHLFSRVEVAAPLAETLRDEALAPEHHQLRIKIKHLRYTAEIMQEPFVEVFDAADTIARLKGLQDALGVLNDAQDLLHWLEGPVLKKALGKKIAKQIRGLADDARHARYEVARDVVLADAPALFGELRRAAGLIGPLPG